jgi:hypothetical protein
MHALRSLERDGSDFDPRPISWTVPHAGWPDFINEDDARAFYAQKYAYRMRRVAEESLAELGVTSHGVPYYVTA